MASEIALVLGSEKVLALRNGLIARGPGARLKIAVLAGFHWVASRSGGFGLQEGGRASVIPDDRAHGLFAGATRGKYNPLMDHTHRLAQLAAFGKALGISF